MLSEQYVANNNHEHDFYDPHDLIFIQSRAITNYSTIEEYAKMMTNGIVFDPIEAVQDAEGRIYVWDGYHRGEAAKRPGVRLRVRISPGTEADARWLALSANQKHGLRRTKRDKYHIVRQALLHPYSLYRSDRALTRHCGVDRRLVVKVRSKMEEIGEIPMETKRLIQREGQTYEINIIRAAKAKNRKISGWLLNSDKPLIEWICELCTQPQNKFDDRYRIYFIGEKQVHVICSECLENRIKGVQELPEHMLDHQTEIWERQSALQAWLVRQQITLINERLAEYPELRHTFLESLRNANLGQKRTIDELAQAITQALVSHGVRFDETSTWNSVPTLLCLGYQTTFEKLREVFQNESGELAAYRDGVMPQFCQYLRLFPHYVNQFRPTAEGSVIQGIVDGVDPDQYPPSVLTPDGKGIRGENHLLLNDIEAYCVAADVHTLNSCFHQQETAARQATVEALQQAGLPAVLPQGIKERKATDGFIWLEPQLEGKSCTPQSCKYANSNSPGFVVLAQPGGTWQMVCVHTKNRC